MAGLQFDTDQEIEKYSRALFEVADVDKKGTLNQVSDNACSPSPPVAQPGTSRSLNLALCPAVFETDQTPPLTLSSTFKLKLLILQALSIS